MNISKFSAPNIWSVHELQVLPKWTNMVKITFSWGHVKPLYHPKHLCQVQASYLSMLQTFDSTEIMHRIIIFKNLKIAINVSKVEIVKSAGFNSRQHLPQNLGKCKSILSDNLKTKNEEILQLNRYDGVFVCNKIVCTIFQ